VEEQRLRAAGLRGECVALREPRAEVRPGAPAEVRHEMGVLGDHALSDGLAHQVGEALRDATRRCAPKAEHVLRRHANFNLRLCRHLTAHRRPW
jgi:hypothetical protein